MSNKIIETESKKDRYNIIVNLLETNEMLIFKRYANSTDDAKQLLSDFLKNYYDNNFNIVNIEKDKTKTLR